MLFFALFKKQVEHHLLLTINQCSIPLKFDIFSAFAMKLYLVAKESRYLGLDKINDIVACATYLIEINVTFRKNCCFVSILGIKYLMLVNFNNFLKQ